MSSVSICRVVSCLLAGVAGVAPPAVILPPPVQSPALSSGGVVSQLPGAKIGNYAATDANLRSTMQFASAPGLGGQSPIASTPLGSEHFAAAPQQTLRTTSQTGAMIGYQEVSQPPDTSKMLFTEAVHSFGALLLATLAGAAAGVAGIRWLDQRRQAKSTDMELGTELTACSIDLEQPRLAVAAFAGESIHSFDPVGLKEANIEKTRKTDIIYGRQALVSALEPQSLLQTVEQPPARERDLLSPAAAGMLLATCAADPALARIAGGKYENQYKLIAPLPAEPGISDSQVALCLLLALPSGVLAIYVGNILWTGLFDPLKFKRDPSKNKGFVTPLVKRLIEFGW